MHELSVTESILEITLRHANQAGAAKVTDLYLVIGQLATLVDDSIQFYWEIIAADTIAAQAKLHFRRIPAEMTCQACGQVFNPDGRSYDCPACGSPLVRVTAGEEFFLEAINVES